jgi:hypothetical protein
VFAPTDDAFAKLPAGTVEELLKPENKAKLAAILTYHVVSGKVMASTVVTMDGAKVPTVNGAEATIKVGTDGVMVDGAKVVTTDIECANGVIHVIDSVILPAAAKAYSVDELKQEGEAVVASRMTTQAAYQALAKEAKILADDDVASFLARAQMRSAARATARADTAKGTPEPVAAAPARVAKAATRVPSPPPSSPAAGGALSVETARSVNQLLEIDTRSIRLPETVVEYFESQDLLVPNRLDEEQQDSWLGAIAAGTGLLFALNLFEIGAGMDLLLSAIIGGGLSGYAALRKDGVGDTDVEPYLDIFADFANPVRFAVIGPAWRDNDGDCLSGAQPWGVERYQNLARETEGVPRAPLAGYSGLAQHNGAAHDLCGAWRHGKGG